MIQAQIYIDKDELKGTKPLHQFIMQLLIDNGIAGAIQRRINSNTPSRKMVNND